MYIHNNHPTFAIGKAQLLHNQQFSQLIASEKAVFALYVIV